MADEKEHVHSQSAYEMLEGFKIGTLGGSEKTVSEGESCWSLRGLGRGWDLIDRVQNY